MVWLQAGVYWVARLWRSAATISASLVIFQNNCQPFSFCSCEGH